MPSFLETIFDAATIGPHEMGWKAFSADDVLVQISGNNGWTVLASGLYTLSNFNTASLRVTLAAPMPGRQVRVRRVSTPVQREILSATDPAEVRDVLGVGGGIAPHSHVIADVEGLPEALDGKLDAAHAGAGGTAHEPATAEAAGFMSASDKEKLNGVDAGATANSPDFFLLDRNNHTGTQPIPSIDGLEGVLEAKSDEGHEHGADKITVIPPYTAVPAAPALKLSDAEKDRVSLRKFDSRVGNNNSTVDTAAFLAAIAAIQQDSAFRGCRLSIPHTLNPYRLGAALTVTAHPTEQVHNVILQGQGWTNTRLDFADAPSGARGLFFTGQGAQLGVEDLEIAHAPAENLVIDNASHWLVKNVRLQGAGAANFKSFNTFMGRLDGVWAKDGLANGFDFAGFHTSITARACFGEANAGANWRLNSLVYSNFLACGGDAGDIGWDCTNLQSVGFSQCGAESNHKDGWLFRVSNALSAGIPVESQDISVTLDGCFGYLNNRLDGSYANLFRAVAQDGRKIVVRNASPRGALFAPGHHHVIASATGGGRVDVIEEALPAGWRMTASGLVVRENRDVRGLVSLFPINGVGQTFAHNTLTTVVWSTTATQNDFGATMSGAGVLTLPAGASKVRLTVGLTWASNATGDRILYVAKNGSYAPLLPQDSRRANASNPTWQSVSSAVIDVDPAGGNTLRVDALQTSGSPLDITAGNGTFICVEGVR